MISRQNVSLVGFMGCGKSTVGRVVASRTGLELVDFDERIVDRAGISIAEMFRRFGEEHFRDLETELLRGMTETTGRLLLPGGGIVLRAENRRLLRRISFRIWLRAGPPEILRRLTRPDVRGERPLFEAVGEAGLPALMKAREPFYRQCDDVVEIGGRDLAEIVDRVISSIRRHTRTLREGDDDGGPHPRGGLDLAPPDF